MKCSKCKEYSFLLRRCKLGKINPKSVKGGVDAAHIMGIDYICNLSELKSKIVEKMTSSGGA